MSKNYQVTSDARMKFMGHVFTHALLLSAYLLFAFAGNLYAANIPENEDVAWAAPQADCDVFQESNGLVVVQAESKTAGGWAKKQADGAVFLQWSGKESFNSTSSGKITYKINFKTPGIYRFVWRNTIKQGSDKAEHNDSWLKFPNNSNITFFGHDGTAGNVASDLKAKKNVIFPGGSGMSPTPKGSSRDGFFKVYANTTTWKWLANTSDHDPHKVYIDVKKAGTYEMQVSGRSTGHAIDGVILYHLGKQGGNLSDGTLDKILKSVSDCSDTPVDPDPEPTNTAPNIAPISDKVVKEGNTLTTKIFASDANNDPINLSVVIKRGTTTIPASSYQFTTVNKGKEGTLTLPTKKGDAGKLNVTVKAGDGKAATEKMFSIQINKADDPNPDPDPGNEDIIIYLVDVNTNKDIKALENNASFGLGNVSLRAEIKGLKLNGVRFTLTGGPNNMNHVKKEGSQPPYGVFGDKGVKLLPWKNIKTGKYRLKVEVLGGKDVSKTINFTVTGEGNPKPDPDPTPGDDKIAVAKFFLINPSTNKRIKELKDGDKISNGNAVNIEAITSPNEVGSVRFKLNGGNISTENEVPYAMGGDNNGNFGTISLRKGKNTLEAIPYAQAKARGEVGAPLKISVTVENGANARIVQPQVADKTTTDLSADGLYSDFKIARLYPNPVAEELTMEYVGESEKEDLILSLVSRIGQEYKISANAYQMDGSSIKVNMASLNVSAGVYLLKVASVNTGKTEIYRLIKY